MMTLAALVMLDHGHDLAAVSIAISAHFLGMFALVLVVGRIVDRFGRVRSLVTGLIVMAGGVLAFLPGGELVTILPGMFFIGLGWNLAFVAATALLSDAAPAGERARLLGLADFLGVGASALLAISGAAILDAAGIVPVALGAALLALAPLAVLPVLVARPPRLEQARP
jgi:MFS family permease